MIRRGPRPADRFAMIANEALENSNLTWRARGVLAYLLSRPEGWSTSAERLAGQSPKGREGRDAMRAVLKELEAAGYLRREKTQDDRGRWSTSLVVYDYPQDLAPATNVGSDDVLGGIAAKTGAEPPMVDSKIASQPPILESSKNGGSPGVGKPAVGSPAVGKPGVSNKTENKTENKTKSSLPNSPEVERPIDKLARWPGVEYLREAGSRWSWLTVDKAWELTQKYVEQVRERGWQYSPDGWLKFMELEDQARRERAKGRAYAPNGVPL